MTNEMLIQGIVLLLYLVAMIMVGFVFYKKNTTNADYILGGRQMNVWVTSMSAQASDMSGWLLMGLPGLAYLLGAGATEAAWTAIGLAIGTYLNWLIVAKPLRKYTQIAGDSITLPDFFHNRFRMKTPALRVFAALFILIFFTVYTSSMFAAGAKLFDYIFGIGYTPALILSVVVVTAYTFLGGFKAVSWTDLFQGLLMFFALIFVVFFMWKGLSGVGYDWSALKDFTLKTSPSFGVMSVIGAIAWGLGYFGQPHILVRFMGIKSSKEIKPARRIAMVWVIISLAIAVLIGMIGNPFVAELAKSGVLPANLFGADGMLVDSEKIFMILVQHMFPAVISGVLLAAVLAAIMSTADSQLLVSSSSFSSDIYNTLFDKNASEKKLLWVSRLTIVVIALIACILAIDPNSSVFQIVSHAWAGFGAAFGPIILCSLFWKRTNGAGALAGIISGGAIALLWAYLPAAIWGANAPAIFSLYEIVPGFIVSLICIFVVSLCTKAPSEEIVKEFESVKTADV